MIEEQIAAGIRALQSMTQLPQSLVDATVYSSSSSSSSSSTYKHFSHEDCALNTEALTHGTLSPTVGSSRRHSSSTYIPHAGWEDVQSMGQGGSGSDGERAGSKHARAHTHIHQQDNQLSHRQDNLRDRDSHLLHRPLSQQQVQEQQQEQVQQILKPVNYYQGHVLM